MTITAIDGVAADATGDGVVSAITENNVMAEASINGVVSA